MISFRDKLNYHVTSFASESYGFVYCFTRLAFALAGDLWLVS